MTVPCEYHPIPAITLQQRDCANAGHALVNVARVDQEVSESEVAAHLTCGCGARREYLKSPSYVRLEATVKDAGLDYLGVFVLCVLAAMILGALWWTS